MSNTKLIVLQKKISKFLKQRFVPVEPGVEKMGLMVKILNHEVYKTHGKRPQSLNEKVLISLFRYLKLSLGSSISQRPSIIYTSKNIFRLFFPQSLKEERKSKTNWLGGGTGFTPPKLSRGFKGTASFSAPGDADRTAGRKLPRDERKHDGYDDGDQKLYTGEYPPTRRLSFKRQEAEESFFQPPPSHKCRLSCPLPPPEFFPPEKTPYISSYQPPCVRFPTLRSEFLPRSKLSKGKLEETKAEVEMVWMTDGKSEKKTGGKVEKRGVKGGKMVDAKPGEEKMERKQERIDRMSEKDRKTEEELVRNAKWENMMEGNPEKEIEEKLVQSADEKWENMVEGNPEEKTEENLGKNATDNLENTVEGRQGKKGEEKLVRYYEEKWENMVVRNPGKKTEEKQMKKADEKWQNRAERRPEKKAREKSVRNPDEKWESRVEGRPGRKAEEKLVRYYEQKWENMMEINPGKKTEEKQMKKVHEKWQNKVEGRPGKKAEEKIVRNADEKWQNKVDGQEKKTEEKQVKKADEKWEDWMEGRPATKTEEKLVWYPEEKWEERNLGKKTEEKLVQYGDENWENMVEGNPEEKTEEKLGKNATDILENTVEGRQGKKAEEKLVQSADEKWENMMEENPEENTEEKQMKNAEEKWENMMEGSPEKKAEEKLVRNTDEMWENKVEENPQEKTEEKQMKKADEKLESKVGGKPEKTVEKKPETAVGRERHMAKPAKKSKTPPTDSVDFSEFMPNTVKNRKNYLNLKTVKSQMYIPPPVDPEPKMKALLFEPMNLALNYDTVDVPTRIFKDEILVQVAFSGVCGFDLFITEGKVSCGDNSIILGHEISGKVYAVGSAVTHVKPGDSIAVDAYTGCSSCRYCSRGHPFACCCEGLANSIGLRKNGGWAEFVVVNKSQVHKVPEGLSLDQAALTLPLSCILSAMSKLKLSYGMPILIQGLGLTGNLWATVLHARGFKNVFVSDKNERRRKQFESLNLNYAFIAPEDIVKYVMDVVIECTGSPTSIEKSFNVLNPKGQVCLFGKPSPITEVRCIPYEIIQKEITVLGTAGNAFCFSEAIDVAASMGRRYLDLEKLGVREFELEDFRNAFQMKKTGEISKIVFKFDS